jgi:hypothetical protein
LDVCTHLGEILVEQGQIVGDIVLLLHHHDVASRSNLRFSLRAPLFARLATQIRLALLEAPPKPLD